MVASELVNTLLSPFMISAEPSEDLSLYPTGISEREQDGGHRKRKQQCWSKALCSSFPSGVIRAWERNPNLHSHSAGMEQTERQWAREKPCRQPHDLQLQEEGESPHPGTCPFWGGGAANRLTQFRNKLGKRSYLRFPRCWCLKSFETEYSFNPME